jgi:hypothetical protein
MFASARAWGARDVTAGVVMITFNRQMICLVGSIGQKGLTYKTEGVFLYRKFNIQLIRWM